MFPVARRLFGLLFVRGLTTDSRPVASAVPRAVGRPTRCQASVCSCFGGSPVAIVRDPRSAREAPGEVLAVHSAAGFEIPDRFVHHCLVRAAYAGGYGRLPEGVPVAGPRQHREHRGLPPGGPLRETREPDREAAAEHRQGLVQRRNRPLVRRPWRRLGARSCVERPGPRTGGSSGRDARTHHNGSLTINIAHPCWMRQCGRKTDPERCEFESPVAAPWMFACRRCSAANEAEGRPSGWRLGPVAGEVVAVVDLAWPHGLRESCRQVAFPGPTASVSWKGSRTPRQRRGQP